MADPRAGPPTAEGLATALAMALQAADEARETQSFVEDMRRDREERRRAHRERTHAAVRRILAAWKR